MNTEHDQGSTTLKAYLYSLDTVQLSHTLDEVLTELRKRESNKIKRDVMTRSQSVRVKPFNA